ncbi:MAG: glycosyltransferase family 4 protein [Chloroflexota bacterium]
MRWLLITRKLDPADDHVGFVMRWVELLAARLDHLDVICQEHANPPLPANVTLYSMGKEAGAGRIAQAWRFTAHLWRLVPGVDGVFCHMIPRYVWFAAPWARLHGRPLLLWYTHRQNTAELRLAAHLATHILTASAGSFPLPSGKVRVMGHGIDAALFPAPEGEDAPPIIAQVARLAHIKRQDALIRAAALLTARDDVGAFRVQLIGGPVKEEPDYPAALETLIRSFEPRPPVTLTGPLPHAEAVALLRRSAIAVNLSPPGLFDKAALEGMFAGKPTLVTNADFAPLLGDAADLLLLPYEAGPEALADRLARLLALSPDERAALGADLRARALAAHSLDSLMDRIIGLMGEAVGHG